jgi:predicted ATPase/DNA-binding CsgD family transcriptional regulator/tetratricopeptide (TPR) repeat protein
MVDRRQREGMQFGNYQLLRLLGQGHFAQVYLGEHIHLGTQAAIKVLLAYVTEADAAVFRAEARTLAQLDHPYIVRLLDFGLEGTVPFLVMSYAPHGNLRQRHPAGTRLSLDNVVPYVKQVAAALQYLHDQRLIHRDLKPENLLLSSDDKVLLSDFELVTLLQNTYSQPGQAVAGSIGYMAPEQLQGHPSPASDQYALGVVVYEWLCGERPFSGSFTEVAAKHALIPPPPLHRKVPTIPATVEHVVLKALAKDPQQRFVQIQDFALALEEAAPGESSARTIPVVSSSLPPQPKHERIDQLPALLTPLIGREQEVQALCAQLLRPQVRLVTLVGPGGVGKTRLSLAVASHMQAHFADEVYFVPLAPIRDPELVGSAIAQALHIRERPGQSFFELLKEGVYTRHLLMVLDNVEQVVAVAPQLEELLAACPNLKLLVTSRALLRVPTEQVFPVPPLALPDRSQLLASELLTQSGAVALFVQRAQAIQPSFQLTTANAQAVAEICVRLDGLPLAIELAAARIRLLPPQALLKRLSNRLAVLGGGAPSLPERQQTLRNTLKWSYDLLDPQEQRLFRQLAVFVGGWTLEAAEAVINASQPRNRADISVLDGVASLLDKSLLVQIEQQSEEPQLIMLETVREYGLEVLEASGEMEVTRQAHAAYYLALVEEAASENGNSQQQVMRLERLEREHDNLLTVMQCCLEQGEAGQGYARALRLGGALRRFWLEHGHWSEGQNFLKRALVGSQEVTPPVRGKALCAAAQLALVQRSDYDQAEAQAQESLALYRELADTTGIALSLSLLGNLAWLRGNYAAARSLTEEALALWKAEGDQENVAWSLFHLGIMAIEQGEYSRGHALFEETLRMHRELRNKRGIAASLLRLGWTIYYSQGEPALARSLLQEGLALFRELGDKEKIADSLNTLGWVVLQQDETAMAHSLAQESVVLFRELGQPIGIAESYLLLARVAALQGDQAAARALYEQSLALCKQGADNWDIACGLEGLASVVAAQGETIWAAGLWGAAEALRQSIGAPMPPVERAPYERSVAAVRAHLGEHVFTTTWVQGRAMTPDQVLAAQGRPVPTIPAPPPPATPTASPAKSLAPSPVGLTPREVEVLRLVAQGLTDAQVAQALVISRRTVNSYLTTIYSKIGVSSRSAATRYAMEHHLA